MNAGPPVTCASSPSGRPVGGRGAEVPIGSRELRLGGVGGDRHPDEGGLAVVGEDREGLLPLGRIGLEVPVPAGATACRSASVSCSPPRSMTTIAGVYFDVPRRSWSRAAWADSASVGRLAVELSAASGSIPAPSRTPEKRMATTTTTQLSRRPTRCGQRCSEGWVDGLSRFTLHRVGMPAATQPTPGEVERRHGHVASGGRSIEAQGPLAATR